MIASDSTVIRTLRIKAAASDRLAARQQAERALQAAALRPISLPREAILIVRQIKSRHTGAAGWEQAVNAELDQLARQAARPIEGAVPANAQAVLFADRAELLACLAADWCAGVVHIQWWWQSWLRGGDVSRAIMEAWQSTPQFIPLALQRLAAQRQAVAFTQRLSDAHVQALWQTVVQTFGLYHLAAALPEISAMKVIEHEVITTPPAPPWRSWVQTSSEHLSPDRQVLLAVGLMLISAPSVARSASFASEVKAWRAAIRAQQQDAAPVVPPPPVIPRLTTEAITPAQTQEIFASRVAQPEEATTDQPSGRGGRRPTKQSPPEQRAEPMGSEAVLYSSTLPEIASPPHALSPVQHVAEAPGEIPIAPDAVPAQIEIETEFGGVCYFINLGLFLNLYGDFTTPLQPGLDLPIWDFMALVAQALLGDDVTRDPIWPLLAQLADRAEDEPPGAHFDPTSNVIARSAVGDKAISLDGSEDCFAPAGLAMTPLETWLADLMSLIRPRLQLALGVNDEDLPRYFKQHARLVVSALTFDAYFALADLPIEIRLSGLDRDPGWVPAAGRTVRFHYD